MAITRHVGRRIEYAVPLEAQRNAPDGMVYIHFAWFHRQRGHWLAEWAGYVPAPEVDPALVGDERLVAMNAWRRRAQDDISRYPVLDQAVDLAAWEACLAEGPRRGVCVDVTRFGWPVGDHVWHRYDQTIDDIDPKWGPEHTFIEINTTTLEVVANQRSHRPIRDAVPGQHVLDITHTPWAEHYGAIFGRFVWREEERRWGFEQRTRYPWVWRRPLWSLRHAGLRIPTSPGQRLALAEAPADLIIEPVRILETVRTQGRVA